MSRSGFKYLFWLEQRWLETSPGLLKTTTRNSWMWFRPHMKHIQLWSPWKQLEMSRALLKTHSFVSVRPAGCGPPSRGEIAAFWSSALSPSAPPVDVEAQDGILIRHFWLKCQSLYPGDRAVTSSVETFVMSVFIVLCIRLVRNQFSLKHLRSFFLDLPYYQVLSGRKSSSPTPPLLFWCEHAGSPSWLDFPRRGLGSVCKTAAGKQCRS